MVIAWRGLERETKDLVDATVREATSRGEGIGVAVSEYAHAVLCNSLGQYEEALMAALHATEDSRELVAHNWSLTELVEAAVRSDRVDLATQAHHRLARKAHASGTNWALGMEARRAPCSAKATLPRTRTARPSRTWTGPRYGPSWRAPTCSTVSGCDEPTGAWTPALS